MRHRGGVIIAWMGVAFVVAMNLYDATMCHNDVLEQPEVLRLVRGARGVDDARLLGVVRFEAAHVVRRAVHQLAHERVALRAQPPAARRRLLLARAVVVAAVFLHALREEAAHELIGRRLEPWNEGHNEQRPLLVGVKGRDPSVPCHRYS